MNQTTLPEQLSIEALVSVVADAFMDQLEQGESPEVEAYARRHPQIADVLRNVLPVLQLVRSSTLVPDAISSDEPLPAIAPSTRYLGDFRILREVGRGGMGVVYEAEQISLGRRVALKVLSFTAAPDGKQLQRFQNEARAAAGLHHPHIVPVYFVGSENGVHYYAMQFIEGQTLAALIAELREQRDAETGRQEAGSEVTPGKGSEVEAATEASRAPVTLSPCHLVTLSSFCRTVAQLGLQAALALEHAHQLGVVHRDIKPANLMVDGQGSLWVTDFGLAHCQSQVGVTLSGDLVGTVRYMSPEQALGQRPALDHRTDIYSLGATLYELLTLKPPFGGSERQELLRQIASEEPQPLRRLNKAIPADLETIVLKMMEKIPSDRYATAQEAAGDLERFLKDEPILARRPTPLQRARRWARRHRSMVGSAAVASLVTLAILAGSAGWIVRDQAARRARIATEIQLALGEAQRSQRDGRLPQALSEARRAEALLLDGPTDLALVERVSALLRELAEAEADREMVARLEDLRLRQADLNVKEGSFALDRALPDYREAFGSYGLRVDRITSGKAAVILKRRPAKVRATLVAALDRWLMLARQEKCAEVNWLENLVAQADTDPWRRSVRVAREKNDLSALEKLAREVDVAAQPPETLWLLELALFQRGAREAAVALLRRAQVAFPGDFWINLDLGLALQDCHPPGSHEAIRFLTVAVALRPESAGAWLDLGEGLREAGRLDDAMAAWRKAIELKPTYAEAHWNLSYALCCLGRRAESQAAYRQAIALKPELGDPEVAIANLRKWAQKMPNNITPHFQLALNLLTLGQLKEAAVEYRRVIELDPANIPAHYQLAQALRSLGQAKEATAAFRQLIALKPERAEFHWELGLSLQEQGEFAASLVAFQRAHELGSQRENWPYPTAARVERVRRQIELDGRLQAVLQGELQPANAAERNEYAEVCIHKRLYVASARLRFEAFRADPKLADDAQFSRYNGACAAARASCGQGEDASQLDDQEKLRWRKQALEWLQAELAAKARQLESGKPADGLQIVRNLRHWQRDLDLACLRDPAAVAKLPADEQQACKQLWAELQEIVIRVETANREHRARQDAGKMPPLSKVTSE